MTAKPTTAQRLAQLEADRDLLAWLHAETFHNCQEMGRVVAALVLQQAVQMQQAQTQMNPQLQQQMLLAQMAQQVAQKNGAV